MVKIKQNDIQRNVDKSNRSGFQGARINTVSNPTPNLFPNTGTEIHRTNATNKVKKPIGSKLNPTRVAEGEFLGKSVEMRGKRKENKFRDKEIEFYDPIRMFRENKAGQFTRDSGAGRGGKFTTKPSGKYEDQLGKITVLDPNPKQGLQTGGAIEYAPIKNMKLKLKNSKLPHTFV